MENENCLTADHHHWKSVQMGVKEDIYRYLTRSAEESARGLGFVRRLSAWLTPELMCLTLYRVSHYFHVNGWVALARFLSSINFILHKVRLPAASCIGPGCRLSHPAGVVFEGRAGKNLTIFSYAVCMVEKTHKGFNSGTPAIGDSVTLGGHAVLMGDISIGDFVQVSPGAVVCTNIPDHAIIASHKMHTSIHHKAQENKKDDEGVQA